MSEFAKKVLAGEATQDEDWVEYLIQAHAVAPSMSPKCFAQHEIAPGLNSYGKLASTLDRYPAQAPMTLIDLACGDGHLIQYCFKRPRSPQSVIGVDMSPDELAIAKQTYRSDGRVRFLCERAQEISLPDSSVDVILCHMAFMLMVPVEPVVQEIRRLLKPGGVFSAVVGRTAEASGLMKEFQAIIGAFRQTEFPKMAHPRTGDPRAQSKDGIEELFSEKNGFARIDEIDDFALNIQIPPEEIWDFWNDMYLISLLPDQKKDILKQQLISTAVQRKNPDGLIQFPLPMRQFTVIK